MRRHLLSGLLLGLGGAIASWLFVTYAPPGGWDVGLDNLWAAVHIPAWIVAFLIDRNPHGGGPGPVLFGVFLQWFVVGWVCSWIWQCLRGGNQAGMTD